jgi:peroxiredoxin Q/BCP
MTTELKAGDKAPEFSLKDQDGKVYTLKELKGTPVVLYFYPKDDTPGCTKEACGFRDAKTSLKKAGAVLLGVSMDTAESHRKFIAKYQLPFPLLCDEDGAVSKAFGVYKQKNMYGRKFWGLERSTFVIGASGDIKAVFRKVKVDGHVEEVLEALKQGNGP